MAQNATITSNLLQQFEVAYGAGLLGCTVMRVRGTVNVFNNTAGAGMHAQMGLEVGPDDMTAAQLDPQIRSQDDWMYWESLIGQPPVTTESVTVNNYKIDVRAKRKVEELGDTLWWALRNSNPGAAAYTVQWAFSILIALP